ncbi:N-6 DNA methylase [Pseudomonas protegens]|uniref:HsdM family class I SAM-dependent methyltransferase n=1 Tax=Pseudomonas protegens TaxID=380021 RepID=UPI002DBA9638|nr:N-6 DNA methylase [Pseudomonas protegens]WRV88606.1 N-6 DNA methylase [Pseudomonas protegens]
MLPLEIKNKVASLWDLVSGAGLASSPYVALEQIACLIFLKHLDGIASADNEDGRSSVFQRLIPDEIAPPNKHRSFWKALLLHPDPGTYLNDQIFPWLRSLEMRIGNYSSLAERLGLNGMLSDAYFQLDPSKSQALTGLVHAIDELFPYPGQERQEGFLSGEVFEYLFTQGSTSSNIGPLVTARHITRFMVALLDPRPGHRIIDPAAGTAGFLVSAQQYMLSRHARLRAATQKKIHDGHSLVGIDLSHSLARIGWVNLLLHDIESPQCMQGNSLIIGGSQGAAEPWLNERYDFVLSDLPFGGRIDPQEATGANYLPFYARDDQGKRSDKVEQLFVWRALNLLQVGGSAALIIPQNLLVGRSQAQIDLRRELLSRHSVEAVILLPGAIFNPYTGIKAAILVVRKVADHQALATPHVAPPQTDAVWFYEVTQDGHSMDHKRKELPADADNDLFDAFVHFRRRQLSAELWERGRDLYFQAGAEEGPYWTSLHNVIECSSTQVKQWLVPVRRKLRGSEALFPDSLDPDCIEAKDWSLDIDDYKVIEQPKSAGENTALQLIDELEQLELKVIEQLRQLRDEIGEVQ